MPGIVQAKELGPYEVCPLGCLWPKGRRIDGRLALGLKPNISYAERSLWKDPVKELSCDEHEPSETTIAVSYTHLTLPTILLV